jgi:UDP-N-acetyl-D-galactosamine dehydrogenase
LRPGELHLFRREDIRLDDGAHGESSLPRLRQACCHRVYGLGPLSFAGFARILRLLVTRTARSPHRLRINPTEMEMVTTMSAELPVHDQIRIAIIGLGYVGLPLAVAFGRRFPTVGFDIDQARVAELNDGRDHTLEVSSDELRAARQLRCSHDPAALQGCNVFIVTVPTPIDDYKRPDLRPLESASRTVGRAIAPGGVAIYESTVYPGATEEVCVPIIERESGLRYQHDFHAGYSPERINPGDKLHRLETITKVTSGSSPDAARFVDELYGQIVSAGTHRASSIRVAEAAKVIENTQRDVNIALINELALIFERMGIDTHEVLEAAGTKWNFLPFRPGLVGGHCIGVDPYYLTHKAQQIGYHPEVILAGRRINDSMGSHVAQRVVKLMAQRDIPTANARVLILGLAFKENCPDLRNTRVVDILAELRSYHIGVDVHDPWVDAAQARHEYGIDLVAAPPQGRYDAVVIAVGHREFVAMGADGVRAFGKPGAVLFDVKRLLPRAQIDGCL